MRLTVDGASVAFDTANGHVHDLRIDGAGGRIAPLHRAHWVGRCDLPADIPPVDRRLEGDFLCAPFGAHGQTGVPPHGWPANSAWQVAEAGQGGLTARLERSVQGARIEKDLRLIPGQPVLYQTHRISGGQGRIGVAHHPMFRLSSGDRIFLSPKRVILTPPAPLEPGRHWLTYPARSDDPVRFPGLRGAVDLTRYPTGSGHEDFAVAIEAGGRRFGWTALLRRQAGDLIVILKDASVLPLTMLWWSNGGRDRAPWDGRHLGVLGVEDGCASPGGLSLAAEGVREGLDMAPGRVHRLRHAILAVTLPAGCADVADIAPHPQGLRVHTGPGGDLVLPFDPGFFDT